MTKIALGTVQFGMNYGISNTTGQVSLGEISKILDFCKEHNIDTIDTAQGYGESEKVLGQFDLSGFKVITKLIGSARLETSLKDLKRDSVYGLMFHRENECNDQTWKQFESYKIQGLVKKIGVSVYTPDVLANLIEQYPIEIVQFPMNILDQRFIPLLGKLKEKRIEVHTRSIFLQGLLLMDSIPEYFLPVSDKIKAIPCPRLEQALAFGKKQDSIDRMVLGVTKFKEIKEIFNAYNAEVENIDYSQYAIADEKYINPSMWNVKK
jgi:aryl-alcohol dehydrogenase-like predicted oxidoreductase